MDESSSSPIVVVTTSNNQETLEAIARESVSQRLAACCQIGGPITSHYVWEGTTQESTEWQCQIKTTLDRYPRLACLIREIHNYAEPEIVYFRIDGGSESYLKWLSDSVAPPN